MHPQLKRHAAEVAYRKKLAELNVRYRRFPVAAPHGAIPAEKEEHSDGHLLHATIEITHHFLKGVFPIEPATMGACKPANDQVRKRLVEQAAEIAPLAQSAEMPIKALAYLPGPLQSVGLQVGASFAAVAATTFSQARVSKSSGRPRETFSAALRREAPTIAEDATLAGLSEVAVEVVGHVMSEARVVCERLVRIVRFSMFPALKAIRILALRDPGCSRRESLDLAVKLFVNAAILGVCVVVEHKLHEFLRPTLGPSYAHLVAGGVMAVVCVWACARATDALNAIDMADLREERELTVKLAAAQADWSQIDLRLEAVRNQLAAV